MQACHFGGFGRRMRIPCQPLIFDGCTVRFATFPPPRAPLGLALAALVAPPHPVRGVSFGPVIRGWATENPFANGSERSWAPSRAFCEPPEAFYAIWWCFSNAFGYIL